MCSALTTGNCGQMRSVHNRVQNKKKRKEHDREEGSWKRERRGGKRKELL